MTRRPTSTELFFLALAGAVGGGILGYYLMSQNTVWGVFPVTCLASLICGSLFLIAVPVTVLLMSPPIHGAPRKLSRYETHNHPWSRKDEYFRSECYRAGLTTEEIEDFADGFAGGKDDSWMDFVYSEAKEFKYGPNWQQTHP